MSKATDFLAHLGEAPQTSEQLQDASGEDSKTVSNRLTQLKGMALAKRGKEGWIATGKAIVATDATMTVAVPPPKGSKQKRTYKKRVARNTPSSEEVAMFSFFLDDDFDLQVCRKDGEGEAAIIPRLEALRLRDFLNRVGDVMRLT